MTTAWGEDVAEARAILRTELLAWLRIATEASVAFQGLIESKYWYQDETSRIEARFRAAVEAAEHIAGLLRALPQEELPADWLKVVGG